MMEQDILEYAGKMHCQTLHMATDEATGLKAIIAIHSTKLGPALGGCRLHDYPNTLLATIDAVRLAQGMTYKAAISHLPLGGGKMVLMAPPTIKDRVQYFKAVGRFVDSLDGRYITAVDSGTSVEDMDIVAEETKHVTSTSHGIFSEVDPSIMTAAGVLRGIEASVEFKFGKTELSGLHVLLQGVGHVGYPLAKLFHERGMRLTIFDINKKMMERCAEEFGATMVKDVDALLKVKADIFCPCAMGAIINDDTLNKISTPIVAGSANNQLDESRHGIALMNRDILYAPDYVISAGGLIYVAAQFSHITEDAAKHKIDAIYDTLQEIFQRAKKEGRATNEIADELARERLEAKE